MQTFVRIQGEIVPKLIELMINSDDFRLQTAGNEFASAFEGHEGEQVFIGGEDDEEDLDLDEYDTDQVEVDDSDEEASDWRDDT